MTEERMKEYLVNGGELFRITLIDTIRDGGTKVIKTTKDDYYIDKNSENFYSGYELTEKKLITDLLLIQYLTERIETYIKRCEADLERNKNLLVQLLKNYGDKEST